MLSFFDLGLYNGRDFDEIKLYIAELKSQMHI